MKRIVLVLAVVCLVLAGCGREDISPGEGEVFSLARELEQAGLSLDRVRKLSVEDAAVGGGVTSTDPVHLRSVLSKFEDITFSKEPPEPDPQWETLSRQCLYWFQFYDDAGSEVPWFCIGLDPLLLVVNGETLGPYTLTGEIAALDVMKSAQCMKLIPMDTLSPEEQFLVEQAKALFLLQVELTGQPTEQDKAGFFQYLVSTPLYRDRWPEWQTGEGYQVPLADVEEIIFTHLDTGSFDPAAGFGTTPGWRYYDEEKQAWIANDLGGYGGAAALEVTQYWTDGSKVTIGLASYDMESYYRDPREYRHIREYHLEFGVEDGPERFKLLEAEFLN